MKLPVAIIAIGLVIAIASCFLTGILKAPTVTEHDFEFSVTYKLDGEIKTLEGVYTSRFVRHGRGGEPLKRFYVGEYTVDGVTSPSRSFLIAQKDGLELYLITSFNDSYLMNDTKNDYYEPYLEDPLLEAVDREGMQYDDEKTLSVFNVEILSWDYPEPIENTFSFVGFSVLHSVSLLVMLLVGYLTLLACLIFVRKDKSVIYTVPDKLSILLNFAVALFAIPFMMIVILLMQLVVNGDEITYQILLCLPALSAFALAASISLRRKGHTKSGFIASLIFPALFALYIALESVIYNLFS